MPFVVTDNCKLCRFTECVTVCPVSCFHADDGMVYIDNDTCIDCRACVPACPVKAIYSEDELPADKHEWIAINAAKSKVLPVIFAKEPQLPTAERRRAELGL
jgi:ferredoxin